MSKGKALSYLWTLIVGAEVIDNLHDVDKLMRGHKKFIKDLQERFFMIGHFLKKEIEENSKNKHEIAYLQQLAKQDKQSKETRDAKGRIEGGGKSSKPVIQAAIRQKIPFRVPISHICNYASQHPAAQVRKKSQRQLNREAKNPMKTAEELTEYLKKSKTLKEAVVRLGKVVADEDLNLYIPALLKQMSASYLVEFMDDILDWMSPLKAEVCFGTNKSKSVFYSPRMDSKYMTKLYRAGLVEECPFYPIPQRPSFIPDLVIPEYRKRPITLENIFVLVEIKFENDRFNKRQIDRYKLLRKLSQEAKDLTKLHTGLLGVTTKFSVLRVPEDLSPKIKEEYFKNEKQREEYYRKNKKSSGFLKLPF